MKKIIVDMFGADAQPEVIVRGAARALHAQTEYNIVLVGSKWVAEVVLQEEAARMKIAPGELLPRAEVIDTNAFVTNHDDPRVVIKDRPDASMVLALEALKEDPDICAMVTAGSTGCALVGSCFHLGLQKGLLQPALASLLPKAGGGLVCLLDCGANLSPRVKELEQYACMGAKIQKESCGVENPKVGLINVGKEADKGTDLLREAYEKITAAAEAEGFTFVGNIEGGDILSGNVDVAICDGFTGNVVLKGFEQAGLLAAEIAAGKRNGEGVVTEDASETSEESMAEKNIKHFFDYNNQAGAVFLGTNKRVIKAHGAATEDTICACILQAIRLDQGKA